METVTFLDMVTYRDMVTYLGMVTFLGTLMVTGIVVFAETMAALPNPRKGFMRTRNAWNPNIVQRQFTKVSL